MEGPFDPFTITLVVENVPNFVDGQWVCSLPVVQHNIPWELVIEKERANCSLALTCLEVQEDNDWSIDVQWKMDLIRTDGKTFTVLGNGRCHQDSSSLRANNLLSWEDLVTEYVANGTLIVEVKVWIVEMTGIQKQNKLIDFADEMAEEQSDVALIVKNEKFFVTKQILALQSPYFHSLFFCGSEQSAMAEIPLEDVEPEHFQLFLEVIYHQPALNDGTVEQVLQLCKKYEARNIHRQCEEFLIYQSHLSNKKKLQLVVLFNLMNLKIYIISNLQSAAHVRAAMDPNLEDPAILKGLLQKSLAFHVNY